MPPEAETAPPVEQSSQLNGGDDVEESDSDDRRSLLSSGSEDENAIFISSTISRDDTLRKRSKQREILSQLKDQLQGGGTRDFIRNTATTLAFHC